MLSRLNTCDRIVDHKQFLQRIDAQRFRRTKNLPGSWTSSYHLVGTNNAIGPKACLFDDRLHNIHQRSGIPRCRTDCDTAGATPCDGVDYARDDIGMFAEDFFLQWQERFVKVFDIQLCRGASKASDPKFLNARIRKH